MSLVGWQPTQRSPRQRRKNYTLWVDGVRDPQPARHGTTSGGLVCKRKFVYKCHYTIEL